MSKATARLLLTLLTLLLGLALNGCGSDDDTVADDGDPEAQAATD